MLRQLAERSDYTSAPIGVWKKSVPAQLRQGTLQTSVVTPSPNRILGLDRASVESASVSIVSLPPIEHARLRSTRCRRSRRNACRVTGLQSQGYFVIRRARREYDQKARSAAHTLCIRTGLSDHRFVRFWIFSLANPSRQSQAAPIAGGARVCVLSSWLRLAPSAMRGLTGSVTFARSGSGKQRGSRKSRLRIVEKDRGSLPVIDCDHPG